MTERISRQEALARGLKRYFTGKPCKNGHVAERLATARVCIECAREAGAATFAKRYSSDPEFVERHNRQSAVWKKTNRDRVKATAASWLLKNPGKNTEYCRRQWFKDKDKRREYNRQYRETNREKVRATFIQWEAANPERAALNRRTSKTNRRSRERSNGGRATIGDIEALFAKQAGLCAACGSCDRIEIDHILPVALGGSSDPHNLQLLCRPCNRTKGDMHPDKWNELN